jgi:hypothetical protein
MAKHLSADLFALRESLIRGDLRDNFQHTAQRKVEIAEAPLEQADRQELEQMMHRTWYETALILTPADDEARISHALEARYISLRARWQRYWTMHQARGGENACPRSAQLLYDLVSDLKSTYLVSIAKALGNGSAMTLWRRCDQLTQRLTQRFKREETDLGQRLEQIRGAAADALAQAGERCTAWPPLVLEMHDQLERLTGVIETLRTFAREQPDAAHLAVALFALDNEALVRGIEEALGWQGVSEQQPAPILLASYRRALGVLLADGDGLDELFDGGWRLAA